MFRGHRAAETRANDYYRMIALCSLSHVSPSKF